MRYAIRVLLGAVYFLAAPLTVYSQSQPALQPEAQQGFSRFFQLQKRPEEALVSPIGDRRVKARAAVRAAPKSKDQRQRLLTYQEERRPQPEAMLFVANNPLLEEVAAGEDRDIAQVIFWNEVALRLTANDHTPVPPGSDLDTQPFEQLGPARTSRAMAIVHIAVFEAINAVYRKYVSYKDIQKTIFAKTALPPDIKPEAVSVRHAVALAAHRTLLELYPGKAADLSFTLAANLTAIQEPLNKATTGMAIGEAAARVILDERRLDGSELQDPPVTIFQTADPRKWQRDPLNLDIGIALGANWSHVRPFVIERADAFRPPVPPGPRSDAYIAAFKEVAEKGGDPHAGETDPPGNRDRRPTLTSRTDAETFIGKFWAYDGTALLCAPPRLYNMIGTSLALQEKRDSFPDALQLARFLALINVVMADAAISAWEAKYYYLYPRPVTALRAAQPGNAPITMPTPFWTPLGAPVTNARAGRLNFTPPFPAYPSGHAVFGGALFQTFRAYWPDANNQAFTFVSDEYNGLNSDPGSSTPRPRIPVSFPNFAKAERDNAESRIYLGIHWRFDAEEGIKEGNAVARYVVDHVFQAIKP
jgi:hypothetical protein